jgi:hypothetical protein
MASVVSARVSVEPRLGWMMMRAMKTAAARKAGRGPVVKRAMRAWGFDRRRAR